MKTVYVVEMLADPGVYKIGRTGRWESRRYAFTKAFRVTHLIRTNRARRLELYMHVAYRRGRVPGNGELFRLSPDDVTAIRRIGSVVFKSHRDGSLIRRWRESAGLTREQMCNRLGCVSVSALTALEGWGRSSAAVVTAVANMVGVPPESLV